MRRVEALIWMRALILAMPFIFLGCAAPGGKPADGVKLFSSYQEIPGVTAEEIAAIEALREQANFFVFGMMPSSVAYVSDSGEIRGFSALLCQWLTELFGIPFLPKHYAWDALLEGLKDGEIDFTHDLTANDERRKIYFMTDPIAQRSIKYLRIAGSPPLSEVAKKRLPRFALLKDTAAATNVLLYAREAFEPVYISRYDEAYELLKTGKADALVTENVMEAVFDAYGDVAASHFLPLTYTPVSLSAQNPELRPIISVVQKAMKNGAARRVNELYSQGYQDYMRHKLFTRLSGEERAYISSRPVIPFAAEPDNYPVSFYNVRANEWQGVSFDVLREVGALTGLEFAVANDQNADWAELLKLLEGGEALMGSELIRSKGREGRFLWPRSALLTDKSVLISKTEHRDININEILSLKVGLTRGGAQAELFKRWFQGHGNTVEFANQEEALRALTRGEVDMIMASGFNLLYLTHYLELPGYKANIVFDNSFESTFGFHKDAVLLSSIVDKALELIDTEAISGQWLRRTYDYRAKLVEARMPWMIGAAFLLLSVLILMFVLFQRTRREGRRLEELVKERTAKLEAVINNYRGVIWSVDVNRVITTFSGHNLKKIGLQSKFWVGKSLDIARQKNKHVDILDNIEKTFLEGPQDWISDIDGVLYQSYTTPMHDDEDRVIGVVGSSNDVTEIINLQQELKTALDSAEAANLAKSIFLANMSHEIRTPMNSIMGYAELAMDKDVTPQIKEYLGKITDNTRWLLHIINDILDISKIESGKMELENVPFDLYDIFSRCQSVILPSVKEKGLSLSVYAEPSVGKKLLGDPVRLYQALMNLLSNAVKFTNSGAVTLKSAIKSQSDNIAAVYFEVKDSGIGLNPENVEKIFDPFIQADSSTTRNYGGTGLGLSITKNIVEQMGGTLMVESSAGFGSKFSFELKFNTVDCGMPSQTEPFLIEKPYFNGLVLLCEDNPMNQDVMMEHLARVGLEAVIADNGKIGVEIVEERMRQGQKPFDLIFMDIFMPVMDGFEAASKIKALGTRAPIVALTANLMAGEIENYIKSGMSDYLGKPFTSQELWRFLLKFLVPVSPSAIKDGPVAGE